MLTAIQNIAVMVALTCSGPADVNSTETAAVAPAQINHVEPHWGVEISQARLDYVGSIA